MRLLLVFARVYSVLLGAMGLLFGQLFSGNISLGASLAGVSGIVGGLLGVRSTRSARVTAALVCLVGIVGVAIDAYRYYRNSQIPGDYYAWALIGPFVLALLFIGYRNVTASA